MIKKAGEMHDELIEDLKKLIPLDNFSTQCAFQPIATVVSEHSVQRGGNVLGIDKSEDALLWLITGATKTPEQHAIMRERLMSFSTMLEEFAESHSIRIDWQYLNYVHGSQNPLKSYGKENVHFIRKVAAKYDPSGIFQKKIVSGWKISDVVT